MAVRSNTNSDYVALTAPGTTQSFTLECWTYFEGLPGGGGFQTVWSIDDNASDFRQLFLVNTGSISYSYTPLGGFDLSFPTSVVTGVWYRTIVTQQPGATGSTFYLGVGNAALQKQVSGVSGGNNPDTVLYLFNERGLDQNTNGHIAGVKLWDRVLSEPEIIAQGQQLAPLSTRGLRYYLPFKRKQGPQISEKGYGGNGTLNGTLSFDSRMPPVPEVAPPKETVRKSTFKRFKSYGPGIGVQGVHSAGDVWTVTLTGVSAGASLVAYSTWGDDVVTVPTISDSVNGSWPAAIDVVHDTPQTQYTAQYEFNNSAIGSGTTGQVVLSVTFGSGASFQDCAGIPVNGVAVSALDKHTGQYQNTASTSTDFITSGNTSTLARQPAIVIALSNEESVEAAPNPGTGFTGLGAYLSGGASARLEWKRVTATTAVAGTFTGTGSGDSFATVVMVLLEPATGTVVDVIVYEGMSLVETF